MYFDNLENVSEDFWTRPEKVLTDLDYLSLMTFPVESLELGEKIAAKLLISLNHINKKGRVAIGLAANQIGINKSVFVINVDKPLIFINPDVIELSKEKTQFKEGCMSIPKKIVPISRHLRIKVKADNLSEPTWFGVEWNGGQIDEVKFLEAVTIQHEFNHLHGILITDLDERPDPYVAPKLPGRNDKIKISKGIETKEIKYKNLEQYEKDGWNTVGTPGESTFLDNR